MRRLRQFSTKQEKGASQFHKVAANNPRFWSGHNSYRFTLPQTLFKTQKLVEGFGSLMKAAIHHACGQVLTKSASFPDTSTIDTSSLN
jgi:hypothetical protein